MEQSSYYITRSSDGRLAEVDWPARKSCAWFKYTIRIALDVDSSNTFLLVDADGAVCVVSPSLPPGRYSLLETACVETVHSLAARSESHASSSSPPSSSSSAAAARSRAWHDDEDNDDFRDDDDAAADSPRALVSTKLRHAHTADAPAEARPESFEQSLLQLAMADALIANERTYLAWMRTSLAVMTCCFSFAFLADWSERGVVAKAVVNLAVVLFALSFLGCFLVGYVRYRMFARLLRAGATSASLQSLDVDWSRSHVWWVYQLGGTLAFSSVVYLGVMVT